MSKMEMETAQEAEETTKNEQISQVEQLFSRLIEEIEASSPENVIYFIIDFLCKYYPNHVHGLGAIFSGDSNLEYEKMAVMEFMKSQKLPGEIAGNFIASGFDTLETLETVTMDNMYQIEQDNGAKWLTGHKVRLQQVFADAPAKIKGFKDEKDAAIKSYMTFHQAANATPATPSTTVYMTQQAPTYPAGSFKTSFTSSAYVKPLTHSSATAYKYSPHDGMMLGPKM